MKFEFFFGTLANQMSRIVKSDWVISDPGQ